MKLKLRVIAMERGKYNVRNWLSSESKNLKRKYNYNSHCGMGNTMLGKKSLSMSRIKINRRKGNSRWSHYHQQ
jgi:hypothetical protein